MSSGFEAPRRGVRIDVLIPSSFSWEAQSARDRMLRLGLLARALAAARVETLIIYHEDPGSPDEENARRIKLVMDYLNTAPYLRRRVFGLVPELRYAGVLPPLNLPTHPERPGLDYPHYREGLVISSGSRSVVEAGLGRPIRVRRRLARGSRVFLRVEPGERPRIRVYSWRRCPVYPGFRTAVVGERIPEIVEGYDLRIATSRRGRDFREVSEELGEKLGEGLGPEVAQEEIGQVVEGIRAKEVAHRLARKYGLRLPIVEGLHEIIFSRADPRERVYEFLR